MIGFGRHHWMMLSLGVALAGCARDATVPTARREAPATPRLRASAATHVDSAVPRAVALERFQRASEHATALSSGASSRDELVRRFARAVEVRDTAALRRLVLSRGEFAYLYYPTSRQGLPPYDLSPDLMWFMIVERSDRGMSALLAQAGQSLDVTGYRCVGDSTVEGKNRLWGPCLVRRVQAPGDTVEARLFGPILEREGRYKFVSYSNKL